MKNGKSRYTKIILTVLTALALTCLSSLTGQGNGDGGSQGGSIEGLWRVQYSGDLEFESFDQWHKDGQEFEVANIFGLSCQGTWEKAGGRNVRLFHTGWNYDANGQLLGYFNERQTLTVSQDRQSYEGTWELKDYDVDGNQLDELSGTLHAARLTVNTPL